MKINKAIKSPGNFNIDHFFTYPLLMIAVGIFLLPKIAFFSSITEENIINLTNKERINLGIPPLTANQLLSKAAYDKGKAIIASQTFQHNIEGKKFSTWIKEAGYEYAYVGENLAIDFNTSEGAVKAWLESPSHRKNLLNDKFREIGIAVIEDQFENKNTKLIVQIFGTSIYPASSVLGENIPTQIQNQTGQINLPEETLEINLNPVSQGRENFKIPEILIYDKKVVAILLLNISFTLLLIFSYLIHQKIKNHHILVKK